MPNPPIEYIPSSVHHRRVILWILRNPPAVQFERMKPYNGFILKFKTRVYPPGQEPLTGEMWKKCVFQLLFGKRSLKNW